MLFNVKQYFHHNVKFKCVIILLNYCFIHALNHVPCFTNLYTNYLAIYRRTYVFYETTRVQQPLSEYFFISSAYMSI